MRTWHLCLICPSRVRCTPSKHNQQYQIPQKQLPSSYGQEQGERAIRVLSYSQASAIQMIGTASNFDIATGDGDIRYRHSWWC